MNCHAKIFRFVRHLSLFKNNSPVFPIIDIAEIIVFSYSRHSPKVAKVCKHAPMIVKEAVTTKLDFVILLHCVEKQSHEIRAYNTLKRNLFYLS